MTYRGTMEEIAALKIGDTLHYFDSNRRKYSRENGGRAIYSEHFAPHKIIGETKKSWLVGGERKPTRVSKKDLSSAGEYSFGARGYFTKSAMEDDIWLHFHRQNIVSHVGALDGPTLRRVADLIGYKP